jgi:hypothetical protein
VPSSKGSSGKDPAEMVKPIGGGTVASFHLDMSGLSARVDFHVQLKCGSSMALTGPGGVTSSVTIRIRTLWYCGNLYDLFKVHTFAYIH